MNKNTSIVGNMHLLVIITKSRPKESLARVILLHLGLIFSLLLVNAVITYPIGIVGNMQELQDFIGNTFSKNSASLDPQITPNTPFS